MNNISQITIADDEAAGVRTVLLFDKKQSQAIGRIEIHLPDSGEANDSCLVMVDGREYEATAHMFVRGGKPTGELTVLLSPAPIAPVTADDAIKAATWNRLADSQEWQEAGEGWTRTVRAEPLLKIDYSQPE